MYEHDDVSHEAIVASFASVIWLASSCCPLLFQILMTQCLIQRDYIFARLTSRYLTFRSCKLLLLAHILDGFGMQLTTTQIRDVKEVSHLCLHTTKSSFGDTSCFHLIIQNVKNLVGYYPFLELSHLSPQILLGPSTVQSSEWT